jgi:hypothetical protein
MTEAKRQSSSRTLAAINSFSVPGIKHPNGTRTTPVVRLSFLLVPGTGIEPVRLFRDPGF